MPDDAPVTNAVFMMEFVVFSRSLLVIRPIAIVGYAGQLTTST